MGDECLAEHFRGEIAGFGRRFAKVDAAFEAVFERALAATAGVDLSFDDEVFSREGVGDFFGFLRSGGNAAGAVGDAVFIEEFFGLVFVDVHRVVERKVGIAGAREEGQSIIRKIGPDFMDSIEGDHSGNGRRSGFGRDISIEGNRGDAALERGR